MTGLYFRPRLACGIEQPGKCAGKTMEVQDCERDKSAGTEMLRESAGEGP